MPLTIRCQFLEKTRAGEQPVPPRDHRRPQARIGRPSRLRIRSVVKQSCHGQPGLSSAGTSALRAERFPPRRDEIRPASGGSFARSPAQNEPRRAPDSVGLAASAPGIGCPFASDRFIRPSGRFTVVVKASNIVVKGFTTIVKGSNMTMKPSNILVNGFTMTVKGSGFFVNGSTPTEHGPDPAVKPPDIVPHGVKAAEDTEGKRAC